jgi:hypothetical protein
VSPNSVTDCYMCRGMQRVANELHAKYEAAEAKVLSLEEQLRGAAFERTNIVKYVLMEVARAQVELHDGDTKTLATRLDALHGCARRFLGTREA